MSSPVLEPIECYTAGRAVLKKDTVQINCDGIVLSVFVGTPRPLAEELTDEDLVVVSACILAIQHPNHSPELNAFLEHVRPDGTLGCLLPCQEACKKPPCVAATLDNHTILSCRGCKKLTLPCPLNHRYVATYLARYTGISVAAAYSLVTKLNRNPNHIKNRLGPETIELVRDWQEYLTDQLLPSPSGITRPTIKAMKKPAAPAKKRIRAVDPLPNDHLSNTPSRVPSSKFPSPSPTIQFPTHLGSGAFEAGQKFIGSVKGRFGDSERKVKTRQNAEPASDTGDVEIISSSTFHSSRKRPLSSPGNPLVETKKAKLTQPVSRRSDSELDKLKCIPSTPVPADRHTELAPTPQCPGVVTDHGPAQAEAMEGGADITGSDSKAVLHSIQRYQKEAKTTRADAAATRIETQKCRGELEAYRRDLQMDGSRGTIGSLDPFLEVLMDLQARCSKLEAWKLQQMVDLSRGTRALYAGISPARRLYDAASRVATLLTHFDPNVRSLEDEEITVETLFKTLEGALGSFGSHA